MQILDRKVWKLREKEAVLVKILWKYQSFKEATWEAEEDMTKRYLHLFKFGKSADKGTKFLLSTIQILVSMLFGCICLWVFVVDVNTLCPVRVTSFEDKCSQCGYIIIFRN